MAQHRRTNDEHAYLVAYDISNPKRWRRVYRAMQGYGRWLQLSIFQCRLDGSRRIEMGVALDALINTEEDHVVIIDLGPADEIALHVDSLGRSFEPIERRAVVI